MSRSLVQARTLGSQRYVAFMSPREMRFSIIETSPSSSGMTGATSSGFKVACLNVADFRAEDYLWLKDKDLGSFLDIFHGKIFVCDGHDLYLHPLNVGKFAPEGCTLKSFTNI